MAKLLVGLAVVCCFCLMDSEDLNLCHLFFTAYLGPQRPHFVLDVRQRSPEFSAVLRVSLYEMMYVDVRQGCSPESASCLALEASPFPKFWGDR